MTVGITYTGSETKHNYYKEWVKGEDVIQVITLSEELNNIDEVALCDGIVLSGGIDIAPEFYGAAEGYPNGPVSFNKKRDAFEWAVFEKTQQLEIPVLGICRGMQLVNCFYGGTLVQDLDENNSFHRITNTNDKMHSISVVPNSYMSEVVSGKYAAVNSAHHQAIDKIGDGLYITAFSEEGVPEAMERANKEEAPFLLCVQWHPERMFIFGLYDTPPSKGVRKKFLDAIKTK
ncbi:gamma-glutamyl-gamma-aminobutyrate hydrolase family protein [Niabella sp. W65]|nr:gamma-glutamyl-gamma-aminobutyrate hydrolase family protein [Niabella sp. W65]MCH7362913.1 gamma-glutamyl-gamma-aminobutyrate hydrolase family protein [Niabella sp. W65]ULT38860.1 gamma-glutamyl-gamma-aminobutyrate hydrolase family protein [Niabella sp. I65]